ncbi:MAG: hypothetical protein A2X61_10705 [Ignavibacteria bacterium GWB2_35_12]|nr:MAG: hypothetical protein A2X63_12700 [Ignavibacteria bacterium GWA2_35_8]OGU42702.1 MAG: hypothetical protein A2X61_10705 [Ignavibacteria bacterium GWB2_35_12]OGU89361.1 MAG: hypothetical protein A2220_01060 [Ignavibacteria bacterium RIFOXYA2_FULL_35_10]OGV19282.1 MAG: hypothetical protein A2475_03795 [Ignavibacteria bacterium RIFOXYC2_FULL_35_21]
MRKNNKIKTLGIDDFKLVAKIKKILNSQFKNSVEDIYCYGSRISKNNKDSDFDLVLVTTKNLDWKKEYQYSKIIIDLGIENNIVFDPQFISKADLKKFTFHPYIQEVISTGQVI